MSRREEPPLTNRELRILRGMLDTYEYELERGRRWRVFFQDARVATITVVAVVGVLVSLVQLIVWVTGGPSNH